MINKLERKYGRYAISRLSMYIVLAYIVGYVLQLIAPNALDLLMLNPHMILRGQVWRIVTWAIMPPYTLSIFTIINLFFIYSIGSTMERIWGDFRFNMYIFGGMFFCIAGAFLLYFIEMATGVFGSSMVGLDGFSFVLAKYFTTYYINVSMVMAFAMSVPDAKVFLYFIIPLKMKYFAYIELFFIVLDMIGGDTLRRCVIVLSLINFIIFYVSGRKARTYSRGFSGFKKSKSEGFERGSYQKTTTFKPQSSAITRHKCAICGRTEQTDSTIEFRFCSKCNGNYEYCSEHLFTHKHVE